jgi:hypothetical protein
MQSIRNNFLGKWRSVLTMQVSVVALVGVAFAPAALAQKTFGSPDEGMKELAAAVKAHDSKAVLAVLGNGAKAVVYSGDRVADRASGDRFAQAYDEANKVDTTGDKAIITVGKDAWPFPIPLVKTAAGWRFDAKQGTEELLNRRIGRNELSVIQVVQACVDAQREYYLLDPTKDKLLHYAQKFMSAKGKRDGLYYPTRAGEPPSPLGDLFARAQAAGYTPGATAKPSAYFGYYYRMLKAQGPDAPGGAYDYVVRGKMMGGFALVAYPATYGNSGVMTFIVNQDGVVYQKDLGPSTASVAKKMTKFNPDATWKKL